MESEIKLFLEPRSVAVVGASNDSVKLGYHVFSNLRRSFAGRVYPVNPRSSFVQGVRSYRSLSELPERVDLAVVVVPADRVPEVVENAGEAGVRAVVVESGGFAETGNEELERKLLETARKHSVRVIGPNCIGVFNTRIGLDTAFLPPGRIHRPFPGGLSLISQSGALLASLMDWAGSYGIGVSKAVSLGNKMDVDEVDLLEYLAGDEDTKIVFVYFEGFKKGRGRLFVEAARRLSSKKPLIVYVGGKTSRGAVAARSHTAALAVPYNVARGVLRQAGAIEVSSLSEAFNIIQAFDKLGDKLPRGKRVGIVTDGGGIGVTAVDALTSRGLEVPELSGALKRRLASILPPVGSPANPVDLTGNATDEMFAASVRELARSGEVDSIVALLLVQVPLLTENVAELLAAESRRAPLLAVVVGGDFAGIVAEKLRKLGVPVYGSSEEAASALAALTEYSERRVAVLEPLEAPRPKPVEITCDAEPYRTLARYGIPTARCLTARSEDDAARAVRMLGSPAALKVISPDVTHKSRVGGVALWVKGEDEARKAYRKIIGSVTSRVQGARIEGVLVQEMVPGSLEAFVGGYRDERFGVIVAAGLGGVLVEELGSISFRSFPASRRDLAEMVGETVLSKVLGDKEISDIARTIAAIGFLLTENPDISSVDVNPLAVVDGRTVAVDARIVRF